MQTGKPIVGRLITEIFRILYSVEPALIRDDKNYLQDVEEPIKAFLENPANACSDGTLLKDHILFIVVCYGLPKTTVATYGIARGITDLLPNFGAIINFGQRLQLMYYDVEAVAGIAPRPHKFINRFKPLPLVVVP